MSSPIFTTEQFAEELRKLKGEETLNPLQIEAIKRILLKLRPKKEESKEESKEEWEKYVRTTCIGYTKAGKCTKKAIFESEKSLYCRLHSSKTDAINMKKQTKTQCDFILKKWLAV